MNIPKHNISFLDIYFIYHDDEHVNVYEHEIALVDSLKENEVAVLCCHGNKKIAPWGELVSTRAS